MAPVAALTASDGSSLPRSWRRMAFKAVELLVGVASLPIGACKAWQCVCLLPQVGWVRALATPSPYCAQRARQSKAPEAGNARCRPGSRGKLPRQQRTWHDRQDAPQLSERTLGCAWGPHAPKGPPPGQERTSVSPARAQDSHRVFMHRMQLTARHTQPRRRSLSGCRCVAGVIVCLSRLCPPAGCDFCGGARTTLQRAPRPPGDL